MKKVELLLPAGSLEKAKYAFAYGADAIYAGIPMFSLRAKENNFTLDEVKEIIKYAHSLNKKVYVTTNIYMHNLKIPFFKEKLKEIIQANPDALIVADPGVLQIIKEKYPNACVHLSVQANSLNSMSAKFWHKNGVSRIILPRELSLEEISQIKTENPKLELENFIHGSICISYSGRCLISSYLSHRDANAGNCTNACRFKYKLYKKNDQISKDSKSMKNPDYKNLENNYYVEEMLRKGELHEIEENSQGTYLLNSKDLCALEFLEELIKAQVCSLKIEGRNKSIYYLSIVARVYKEALEKIYNKEKIDYKRLFEELYTVANRDYFPGFLKTNNLESQNYYHSSLCNTHCFLGIVREFKNGKNESEVKIELRNKIQKGDELDFIMPYPKKIKKYKVEQIFIEDQEVETFSSGTGKLITLKLNFEIEEFTIIRKKIK